MREGKCEEGIPSAELESNAFLATSTNCIQFVGIKLAGFVNSTSKLYTQSIESIETKHDKVIAFKMPRALIAAQGFSG